MLNDKTEIEYCGYYTKPDGTWKLAEDDHGHKYFKTQENVEYFLKRQVNLNPTTKVRVVCKQITSWEVPTKVGGTDGNS